MITKMQENYEDKYKNTTETIIYISNFCNTGIIVNYYLRLFTTMF